MPAISAISLSRAKEILSAKARFCMASEGRRVQRRWTTLTERVNRVVPDTLTGWLRILLPVRSAPVSTRTR
jgi:hypothetical protein